MSRLSLKGTLVLSSFKGLNGGGGGGGGGGE